MLTTHLHLAPRLNEWNCTSSSPTRLHGVDSYNFTFIILIYFHHRRSQWPCGLRRRSAAAGLLRLWVWIPLGAWMFVCCEYCVLSSRGFCDELISRPEESCVLETSCMRRPWSTWAVAQKTKNYHHHTTALYHRRRRRRRHHHHHHYSLCHFSQIIMHTLCRNHLHHVITWTGSALSAKWNLFWRRVVTVWYSLADRK